MFEDKHVLMLCMCLIQMHSICPVHNLHGTHVGDMGTSTILNASCMIFIALDLLRDTDVMTVRCTRIWHLFWMQTLPIQEQLDVWTICYHTIKNAKEESAPLKYHSKILYPRSSLRCTVKSGQC